MIYAMIPEEVAKLLQDEFPDAVAEVVMGASHPHVVVVAARWPQVARFLRDDPRLGFNMLRCVSGVDRPARNELEAVYDLVAMRPPPTAQPSRPHEKQVDVPSAREHAETAPCWVAACVFAVNVRVDRADAHIPSVADVWPAADWHEREAYDLVGIVFDGHPDSVEDLDGLHPRRILCPDDWAGYPLRKDYAFPIEYHGIPGTTEHEMPNPVH
jgi:NADH-quinone oxidoreductase subunit C